MIALAENNALIPFTTGQSIMAWILALVIVASAMGVAMCRKAVHAAIYMVAMMLSLSIIYFTQGAEFLGAIQILVYTGAIMMLFLFVIMLVGVQAVDNPRENKSYVLVSAILLGLAFLLSTGAALVRTTWTTPNQPLNGGSNPVLVAGDLINKHYFAVELSATLLIIAAVGAMVLTHSDRLLPRITQRLMVEQRMKAYGKEGMHPGQSVPPGVYATSNALDVPALDWQGKPLEESLPRVIRVRGQARSIASAAPWVVRRIAQATKGGPGLYGSKANESVRISQSWGMPGAGAPVIPASDQEKEASAIEEAQKEKAAESTQTDIVPKTVETEGKGEKA